MNSEKATSILKDYIERAEDGWSVSFKYGEITEFYDIIKLLEEGKKYKSMWKYFVKNTSGDMYDDFKRIEKGWKG